MLSIRKCTREGTEEKNVALHINSVTEFQISKKAGDEAIPVVLASFGGLYALFRADRGLAPNLRHFWVFIPL